MSNQPQAGKPANTGKNPVKEVKKETVPAKTPEQKAAKFKEIGTRRLNRAIKSIEVIGNLSGANYVRTEEQVKTIFTALREAVNDCEKKFSAKSKADKVKISL